MPDGSLDFLHDLPAVEAPRFWEISSGRRLAWNDFGDPAGFPVMYYHGWPSSRLQARLAHHLARERGLRLIAMDRPGIGLSTFEPGRTLANWPALIAGFADSLGIEKFCQLGISGGGPYVFAGAAGFPERLAGSAVLCGAVPIAGLSCGLSGLHPGYRLLIRIYHLPAVVFSPVFRLAMASTHLKPDRAPLSWLLASAGPEDRELLINFPAAWPVLTESFREGVGRGGAAGVMADGQIYLTRPGFDPSTVNHPIRYWHGREDRNIPVDMVREFTGKIPSARLEVVDGLGHFSLALRKAAAALDHLAECARQVEPLTDRIAGEN